MNKQERLKLMVENQQLIHKYIRSGLKDKELEEEIKRRGIKFITLEELNDINKIA